MLRFRKFELWSPKGRRLRAAVYARYSSDLQNPRSLEDQIRDCRARIEAEGWELVGVFSDRMISGDTIHRPNYQALLAALVRGEIDVVISEGLDRLSRDQEHSAALYKRACYQEAIIFTLAEGEIEEWHVGIKSIINAAYLADLAQKTRRGLRGRVTAGASAGGLSYGYKVVPVPEGEDRGGRTIDAIQAAVVVRIFQDYANGLSPRAIAAALNKERVPGPRGKVWSQSTINGNRKRGTGILNNELYVGNLVWNRLRYVKDPETKLRHSRPNTSDKVVDVEVAQLRIIDAVLWDRVRARQAALDAKAKPAADGSMFQSMQRPKFLHTELARCGVCAGGISMISATHLGCSNARNKGEAVCTNRRTVKRECVETTVLDALRTRLMAPELYAAFVRGFTAEWNREQGARSVEQGGRRDELRRLERNIGNLVGGIAESGGSTAVYDALKKAEARKAALEAELATAEAPAPRLMPNLADCIARRWRRCRTRSEARTRRSCLSGFAA